MDRIEEIRERLSKATPGPWEYVLEENIATHYKYKDGKHSANWIAEIDHMNREDIDWDGRSEQAHADADLIANAPTDIAYLLGLIEPWVPVETLPEEPGTWQVWNEDGYQDAWYEDGRWEAYASGFVLDPQPTHYRRIKGPSPTLIKEDRNG